jgi:acyl-Coa thioesterase superfamily protein/acyl-CoA thioesterase superfamily protein
VSDAYFLPAESGRYRATTHTRGPWDPGLQHAGPPAALIGRALERCEPREEMVISRVTFEILHAVPVGELEVSARIVRPGRSVELLEASLSAAGREVVRAAAWRVLRAPEGTGTVAAEGPAPLPDEEAPMPAQLQSGYLRSIEWRPVRGGFLQPGPGAAWTRLRIPIVEGEEPSGLQRVLAVADSGNGISGTLDMREWWFINPELSVHLEREPRGEWICLDASTSIQPGGAGLATSTLSDLRGPLGRGAQTLYVGRRPPAA